MDNVREDVSKLLNGNTVVTPEKTEEQTTNQKLIYTRLLKRGSTGDDVKELQKALIDLGYSCGSYGADGDFGRATENAVM